jgi:hypothetical protein
MSYNLEKALDERMKHLVTKDFLKEEMKAKMPIDWFKDYE